MSNYSCTNCKCEEEKRIIRIELAKLSPFHPDLVVTSEPGINILSAMNMISQVYFDNSKLTKEDLEKNNMQLLANNEKVDVSFLLKEDTLISIGGTKKIENQSEEEIECEEIKSITKLNEDILKDIIDNILIEPIDRKKIESSDDGDKIVIKVCNNGMADNNIDEVEFNKADRVTVLDVFHKHMELTMGYADTKGDMREQFNNLRARFEFDGEEVDLDYELTRSGELKAKSDININELLLQQVLEMFDL